MKKQKKEEHAVKILFYDTKSYDKESFEAKAKDYPDIQKSGRASCRETV